MPTFRDETDDVHCIELKPEIRCYWSEVEAWNETEIWAFVETRWVGNETPVELTVHRVDEESGDRVESIGEVLGTLNEGVFEHRYCISLSAEQMDAVQGSIVLVFEAWVEGYSLRASSQEMLVQRPLFST